MMRFFAFAAFAVHLFSATILTAAVAETRIIDDFTDVAAWSAHPADGVKLALSPGEGVERGSLRFDFAFTGGGYAIARRAVDLDLPENYAFSFRVRGPAPTNHLEFKLIDATNENVWWSVRRDFMFDPEWTRVRLKKRKIPFAWGPIGGGDIRHVAAIEIVVTAGSGGSGTIFLDDLVIEAVPAEDSAPPVPRAFTSSRSKGTSPAAAVDANVTTAWSPSPRDEAPWIAFDLGGPREFSAVTIDWTEARHPKEYAIEISDDGNSWRPARPPVRGNGGRDRHFLPDSEASFLRVKWASEPGAASSKAAARAAPALLEVSLEPFDAFPTRERFLESIAKESRRGLFPRAIGGEQSYWTVVGADADPNEGLLGEDGALEVGRGAFSIEPFLEVDGKLVTWADVEAIQLLREESLPMPKVTWRRGNLLLAMQPFAGGRPDDSFLVLRCVLGNLGITPAALRLFLAIRPFQVNPPSQFLNLAGGVAPIRSISREGREIRVNDDRRITVLASPKEIGDFEFGACAFDEGDVVAEHLERGALPGSTAVRDTLAAASGALAFEVPLPAGSTREIYLVIPFGHSAPPIPEDFTAALEWIRGEENSCRAAWEEKTRRITISLPESASDIARTLEAQLGDILVNRAGPAIQPGARSYARSWIRDGALTSSAMLRTGLGDEARAFLEWYAPHQYESGKIPCVVDARGADPVPEHDSSGEFIFLVAETLRLGGDLDLARAMWPRVRAAVDYLDALRHERLGEEWRAEDRDEFYGILPPSISHEGYSAKPMHSYWDDFFAFRGFRDAAFLAERLDLEDERARIAAIGDTFARDLAASVKRAMDRHSIDYVPGCADLGDFDATSTTIALSPTGAHAILPRAALERTFERYWEFFTERRDGGDWDAFTPYEIRCVGAFVRLGWRERAGQLLDYFLEMRRPVGWRQWPEVVRKDARAAAFLGDLPHTWVGSDYIRSVLDLFAYERDADGALVVGAGVQRAWLDGPGVAVKNMETAYGRVDVAMRRENGVVTVRLEGDAAPPGGFELRPPLDEGMRVKNSRDVRSTKDGSVVVKKLPAVVVYR